MKPHLSNLLATNDPPSEDVMQEINGIMTAPLQELGEAEQRIADLEAQLRTLKEQRAKIESSLQGYRTIMSPIRRLPDDVLHEIFYHCLPSHRATIPSAVEAPLLLTRVSSRWRSVALSSPRLWAQLYISFCDDYRFSNPPHSPHPPPNVTPEDTQDADRRRRKAFQVLSQRVEVVKDWLARSGTCPLSISLSYTSLLWNLRDLEGHDHADDPTTKLFETIISHCHHLKSLELVMPTEVYRQLDKLVSLDLFSALTDLKASLYDQVPYPEQLGQTMDKKELIVSLFKAPHLERVSLDGYPSNGFWAQNTLPFAQQGKVLKYFSSHLMHSRGECFDLLKECENLVHCRLHIAPFLNGVTSAIHGVASLPRLRTFSIVDEDTSNTDAAVQFYSSIDAPQLRWIDYQTQHYGDDGQPTIRTHPLLHLLKKSMELRKLTIDPFCFSDDVLREALQIVSPTLTHLVIGQEAILRTPRVNRPYDPMGSISLDFGFLVVDPDSDLHSEVLLPNVTTLELSTGLISDDTLLRILTSRLGASLHGRCAALRFVGVIFNRPKKLDMHEEVVRYFESCKANTGDQVRKIKLHLEYDTQVALVTDPLSASYGLQNDRLWSHLDLDEMVGDV